MFYLVKNVILCSLFIQLYQGEINLHNMNFLASLFSCGQTDRSSKSSNCLSAFCSQGNQKIKPQTEKAKAKEDSVTLRTMSNSSRPVSSMDNIVTKKLPQPSYLMLRGCFNRGEKEINWGFLVGVVNCRPQHQKLVPASAMRVRIGQEEEVRCLLSLRSNSLDKLLVFWGQLGGEYSVKQLIRCRQPLILVMEQWELMLQMVRILEEELLKTLGEFCLQESSSKIFFNIVTLENKYMLQFEESSLFKQHLKELLITALSLSLLDDDLNSLMQKMTLNDYIQLKKDPNNINRKVRHYLSEIQREKVEGERAALSMRESEEIVVRHHSESLSSQDILKMRKQSKSSDADLEAEYFAQRRKEGEEVVQAAPQQDDENLLIYYFNNEEEPHEEYQIVLPAKQTNFMRKIRSKSEDATYVPGDNLELDDEFFQKYQ